MRILLDPDWKGIFNDLSPEKQLVLFWCILDYPNRDCDIGAWDFIKKQIDRDHSSYQNRCRGAGVARQSKLNNSQSELIKKQSSLIAGESAHGVAGDQSANINNNNNPNFNSNNMVEKLIKNLSDGFNINNEPKYEINHDFSFHELVKRNPALAQILSCYTDDVLIKAQRAIVAKCLGKKMPLTAIMTWVNNQHEYAKGK